jgi:hypothetical protein
MSACQGDLASTGGRRSGTTTARARVDVGDFADRGRLAPGCSTAHRLASCSQSRRSAGANAVQSASASRQRATRIANKEDLVPSRSDWENWLIAVRVATSSVSGELGSCGTAIS